MGNPIHAFDDKIVKQLDGGPIGDKLTTAIADCFMLDWDNRVIQKLKDLEINLKGYKRFFDDTIIFSKSISRKLQLVNGKLETKFME